MNKFPLNVPESPQLLSNVELINNSILIIDDLNHRLQSTQNLYRQLSEQNTAQGELDKLLRKLHHSGVVTEYMSEIVNRCCTLYPLTVLNAVDEAHLLHAQGMLRRPYPINITIEENKRPLIYFGS